MSTYDYSEVDRDAPRWEYGGTFLHAWRGASLLANIPEHDEAGVRLNRLGFDTLETLSRAHVVNLDRAQFEALPRDLTDLTDFDPDPHLPFPAIYVSVGGEYMTGVLIAVEEFDWLKGGQPAGEPFVGFLVAGFWSFESGLAVPIVVMDAHRHMYEDVFDFLIPETDMDEDEARRVAIQACADAMKVVRFLECANVDIAEERMSRQVRRQRQRKGDTTPVGMRVYVRAPTSRRPATTSGEHIEYGHRFEVRGHYKHFGPDTRLFRAVQRDQPEKVIRHPERGDVVRIWQPPHVKGPVDKPLIPKVRVYQKPREES